MRFFSQILFCISLKRMSRRYRSISTLLKTEEQAWITQQVFQFFHHQLNLNCFFFQHRAFRGWCNLKLSGAADAIVITDFERDWKDGIHLAELLESITGLKLFFL